MPFADARIEFEAALSDEVYEAAWRYALRLTGNREDAQDLLQSAILKAIVKFGQLRKQSSFRAWLFAIIRNLHLSSNLRNQVRITDLVESRSLAELDALDRAVLDSLDSLPQIHRETLTLFYLDNLSLSETAEVLGIGLNAVKQRILRARKALRKIYEAEEPNSRIERSEII